MNLPLKKPKKKQQYYKSDIIKQFENQYFEFERQKHPNFPYPVKTQFRDDSANELTKCIIKWLEMNGHFAGRVNTTGTYSKKLNKFIHSGSRKGMADVTAVVNGRHVSIEIKIGRDKLRPEQLKVKDEVEKAGGIYLVVSSFDNFMEQITKWFKMV